VKTRVLAGQGGHTTAQVVNRVVHVEGAGSVIKGGVVIGIVRQALEKGVQFTTYELVKKREEKRHMKDPNVLPLPRRIPIATLAGAVAGVTSALVTYPFQSLGDRLILNVSPCSSFDLFETGKESHYTLVAMPEFLFCLTKFGCKSL
jgi:solute carrier family 25 phosphate transporter 23/24/25/41